ncbi:hypothetical protein ACTFST_10880 [Bacillus cereus group sp. MYBK106-1]|uniref:hypothetical protein n=1 Tax=unclassified Bacillus cereus group TaxID=2750818 RepID=UPI0015919F26
MYFGVYIVLHFGRGAISILINEEIAVELLKDISINSENKFMKKLATKMLKRKWWER